ncbi:MAG: methyltransferase family protein [Gemmatimonadaceae bacterium]
MRPLPFVWPYALPFWAAYIWAFFPEWKIIRTGVEGAKASDSRDAGSLRVLVGGMWFALFFAFALSFVNVWKFSPSLRLPLFVAGVLLIVLGSSLRRYCFRTLGKYFTGDVRADVRQPVIDTGPYALVRHPSYTAGIMMFSGIGLALGSWISFLLAFLGSVLTYGYRVWVEERALLATIGEPYRVYTNGRKRFIPYVV